MSELPDGWTTKRLGELCDLENGDRGKNYPSKSVLVEEGIPFINAGHLNSGRVDMSTMNYIPEERFEILRSGKIRRGDLLFCLRGSVGKSALVSNIDKGAVASSLVIVRPREDVTPEFMAHYFDAPLARHMISLYDNGSAQPNLSGADLKKFEIPLPPLPEQRRIVARIEELFSRLDAGVAALRHAKAQLQRYRQSVLAAAVTGELTKEWREQNPDVEPAEELLKRILEQRQELWDGRGKYKEPVTPDSSDLPDLPSLWTWASLPQLGELNRGKSKHRPRNAKFLYGGPYPFVQTGDIRHARGTINKYSQTYSEEGLNQSRLWPKGTLCITIAANIAESAILGLDACFPDSIVGFIPTSEELDVRYFEFFMQTAREDLDRYAPATAQKNINLKILSEVGVPLPPLAEQHQIVAEVDARITIIDHLKLELDCQIVRQARLRGSILSAAFSGNLI